MSRSVLIIESDSELRDLLSDYLTIIGFKTRTAENFDRAVSCLEMENHPVVLLAVEILSPGLRQRLPELKMKNGSGSVLVGLVSASIPGLNNYLIELGLDEVLHKPFKLPEIGRCVRDALARISHQEPTAKMEKPMSTTLR